jgi:hypothetical protein
MSAADVTLGLCVILAGLWSGLLLTLTTILHPMFRRLDGPAFALEMRRFLPVARRSPTNWIIVIGLVLAPVAALIALRAGTATFVLIALGLARLRRRATARLALPRGAQLRRHPGLGSRRPARGLAARPAALLPPELGARGDHVGGVRALRGGRVPLLGLSAVSLRFLAGFAGRARD